MTVLCGVDLGHVYAGWICCCSVHFYQGPSVTKKFRKCACTHSHVYSDLLGPNLRDGVHF